MIIFQLRKSCKLQGTELLFDFGKFASCLASFRCGLYHFTATGIPYSLGRNPDYVEMGNID